MVKNRRAPHSGLRFYFALSVGLFIIMGVSQLMERQLDEFFNSTDPASRLVAVALILLFIILGALIFLAIDAAYDGVISRMFGSERER